MSDEENTIDLEAARQAMLAGQSLIEHLDLPPDLAKGLYAVAQLHFDGARYDEARQTCLQLAALDPRLPEVWGLLGNCCMREGAFAEALEAWSYALYLKPDYMLALEVTRTALALKDEVSAWVGLHAMRKHAQSPEQRSRCSELEQTLLALSDETDD